MNSRATRAFWDCYKELPPEIQRQAVKQYRLWLLSPRHGSLQFKKTGNKWSARVSDNYRVLGVMDGDTVI
jgi:mRNA-degrading endonuclease RelE of RelBE toxin-antitoxin system